MDRMKTFLLYFLGIVGFMFLSYILENGLLENMYKKIDGEILPSTYDIVIDSVSAKASNVSGFMNFKLTNHSSNPIPKSYIKIDLFSKRGLLAATKYVEIPNLEPGSTRDYEVKFKGTEIRRYSVAIVQDIPDKTNIINLFGWEIDLTDVFGLDLSNATIFGVKLTDIFSWDGLKTTGANIWGWTVNLLNSVPWWGYAIATGIIIWYMPKGFLFGIFPF